MLELIVLGEVPGTDIVISFSVALAMATVIFGSMLLRLVSKWQNRQTTTVEEITI